MLKLGSEDLTNHKAALGVSQPIAARGLKYFLSETIHAQENGSKGCHFAKFLISNFLKGLTYSGDGRNRSGSLAGCDGYKTPSSNNI